MLVKIFQKSHPFIESKDVTIIFLFDRLIMICVLFILFNCNSLAYTNLPVPKLCDIKVLAKTVEEQGPQKYR